MRSVIAALFVVTITGCSAPVAVAPTAVPSIAPSSVPSAPTARPTATPPPTPTPITELSQVFLPLTRGWRPTGPTLMFTVSEGEMRSTLVAVPFGPSGRTGDPTRLLTFTGQGWDVGANGTAIAVAVGTLPGGRLAVWDIATATGRWVTPPAPSTLVGSPIWSKDGGSLFFGWYEGGGPGGIGRIGADGQGATTIATPDRFGQLEGISPDGRALTWSRGQAGGSAEVLDVATGTNTHLDDVSQVVSWRVQQPRVLVQSGGCCAGRPGGSLVLFDDVAMTSRVVAERSALGTIAFGGGAWDPTGTRIAAGRYDETNPYDASLVIIDAATGAARPASELVGVGNILWLAEGIVVSRGLARSATTDVVLVPPQGGRPIPLYQGSAIGRLVVVRP